MKTVQATMNLPEELYLSLSCFGLTRERIISEANYQAHPNKGGEKWKRESLT